MKGSKWLAGIVIAGIGLRLLLWCFQVSPAGDDGMRYLTESINLVGHGVFAIETGDAPSPSAHDLPLWPGIMAVVYWATHSVVVTQYIAGGVNILLMVGSVLFLVSMLRGKPFLFSGRQVAVAAGVLLFMPESIMYSLFHMPDQLAVFSVIAALWFYFRGAFCKRRYYLGATCLFLVAIYAKPICIPLSVALLAAIPFVVPIPKKRGVVIAVVSILAVGLGLCPWMVRNKMAFGTAGVTSISGTNLYRCNWGRLVERLPAEERQRMKDDMLVFESRIVDCDLMKKAQLQGDYAKRQILAHLPSYIAYTLQTHPRLYAGTGSVAMLRYLGLERACDALDSLWGSNNARGYAPSNDMPYTVAEKAVGCGLQLFSWAVLLVGYGLVMVGMTRGLKAAWATGRGRRFGQVVVVLCPILSLLLLAVVIGPITSTRYRFIMIPFFAMLSGYSVRPGSDEQVHDDEASSLRMAVAT